MLDVFPVAADPSVRYTNDFGYERADGRRHQGIDIFADEGTPVLAPASGVVRFGTDPLGGTIFSLVDDQGVRYYGAHLRSTEGASGRRVRAGETIGSVGRTGNAASTQPHLHFELRTPDSTVPINPFPLLNLAERRGASGGLAPWLLLLGAAAGVGYLATRRPGERRALLQASGRAFRKILA